MNRFFIKAFCFVQFIMVVAWVAHIVWGAPGRGTVINLILVAIAAILGIVATEDHRKRVPAIILNVIQVLGWGLSLGPAIRRATEAQAPPVLIKLMIVMTLALIIPCAINALLLSLMKQQPDPDPTDKE